MKTIKVVVNGLEEIIPGGLTVEELIVHCREGDPDLIVEVNGRYVYPKDYDNTGVGDGDIIEFINPNLGG